MVRKFSHTEMNLAGASLDALNAIDDILEGSTEEKTKAKASPSALYAYATDPNYAPSDISVNNLESCILSHLLYQVASLWIKS